MAKFNKSKEWLIEEYVIKDRPRAEIAAECGLTVAGLKSLLIKLDIKKEKFKLDKSTLEKLVNKKLSSEEIAKYLNCGLTTVYRYLKKYGLKILAKPQVVSRYDSSKDSEFIRLYTEEKLSSTKIAELLGVSHKTVLDHLVHCGIKTRNCSKAQYLLSHGEEYPLEFLDYSYMYELYITLRKSKSDIGKIFNCDPGTVDLALKKLNIPIRDNSESKIGIMAGDKHPNWKGGITSLDRRLREVFCVQQVPKVLKRDHYCCQYEGCRSKKHLHVHHIKHFSDILNRIIKEHPDLDPITNINELYDIAIKDAELNDLNNLITYCADCHRYKVHHYKKQLKADDKPIELLENPNIVDEDNQQPSV